MTKIFSNGVNRLLRTPKWWESIGVPADNVRLVELTPDLAAELWERNQSNRNLRDRHAENLSQAIVNDHWQINGEPIIFSMDGTLLDGQHRLRAVMISNKSIIVYMIFDVDAKAFGTIDIGAKRSSADHLHVIGETNTNLLSAVVSLFLRQTKVIARAATPTEVINCLHAHPGLREHLASSYPLKNLGSLSAIAVASYVSSTIDPHSHKQFFAALRDPSLLPADHPVFVLRRRLDRMRSERGRLSIHYLEVIARSWNAFMSGEKLDHIKSLGTIVEFKK